MFRPWVVVRERSWGMADLGSGADRVPAAGRVAFGAGAAA
jgi:hypothetical protein